MVTRRRYALEVALIFILIISAIWFIEARLPLCAVLAVFISISWVRDVWHMNLNWQKKADWIGQQAGFLPQSFTGIGWLMLSALVMLAVIVGVGLIVNPSILNHNGHWWGEKAEWIFSYFFWAMIQQLLYQGYFVNRLHNAFGNRGDNLTTVTSGAVFAAVHAPNPVLMVATFFGGMISANFFIKNRFLYAVALLHAILGVVIGTFIPEDWHQGLTIGPYFLEKLNKN